MTYTAYEETKNGFTLSIEQDDFISWDYHMGDAPTDIFGRDGFGRNWNIHAGGSDIPDYDMIVMIERGEWSEIVETTAYDCEEKSPGKIVVYPDWHDRAITFKTWRNAARGMLRRNGYDLDSIRVEQISPSYHQTSDSYYVAWNQKQLDNWAGRKDAPDMVDIAQYVLNGDVWGYVVSDSNGNCVDSCWGFIGESNDEYMLSEARDALNAALSDQYEIDAVAMQRARPDLYASVTQ